MVAPSDEGLMLYGDKKGQEAGLAFAGLIPKKGRVYNGKGRGAKDLKAVFSEDSFQRYESGLNISTGDFYILKYGTSEVILSDKNMKCEISSGE